MALARNDGGLQQGYWNREMRYQPDLLMDQLYEEEKEELRPY